MQNGKIVLSISLLVSNRIDSIRKCMESLRPILEAIPSELIAVDTVEPGKSDGSIDVVREYTEKIVPFVWCNDFAAARNAGLEKAQGEWFMYIDDDEWLEDASPIITFFQSGEYKKYRYASYTVRSYTNLEGTLWVDTMQGRLFPIDRNTRFTGKIHEAVLWEEPVYELSCYAHHYGYVFKTQEEKNRHIERNQALLRDEYLQNRGNLRLAAHLVQEYEGCAKFTESIELIQDSFKEADRGAESKFWHFLKFHEVLGYVCLKQFDKAYEKGNLYLQGKNLLMGAETATCCIMAEVCDIIGKLEEGMNYLKRYLKLAEKIKGRTDYWEQTVLDIGQFWNEINVKRMYARGVKLAYQLGDWKQTAYFIQKIDWEEKELQILEDTVETLFQYFEEAPFEPWMSEIMDVILVRGFSKGSIQDVLRILPPDSGERRHLLQILAFCKNPGEQVSFCRAEYAAMSKDAALLKQALEELVQNPDGNLLMIEYKVLQYMDEAGITGEEFVEKIPFYKWHLCVEQWNAKKGIETKRKECTLWKGLLSEDSLYLLDLEAGLQEGEAWAEIEKNGDFRPVHQSFLKMAEKFHQVYSRIYHPDIFVGSGMLTVLPPEGQFTEKYLQAAELLERGDEKGYVSLVKEAGVSIPSMGRICRQLLEKYRKEQQNRSREQSEAQVEIAVLIRALKHKAEQLWEEGQQDAAKEIVRQILQIRPDPELAAKYKIR